MRLLLDTQAVYLWLLDDARSLPHAVAAIGDSRNHVFVSAVSFWEIAIKHARGKLAWPADGFEVLLGSAFAKLPILPNHAISAGQLPPHHADPFDRMLVAQASADGLTLVGADPIFAAYRIPTIWS